MLIAEQLRGPVPGGIGTYVRGLQQGLGETPDPDVEVRAFTSRLPVSVRTRLWDRGIGRLSGAVVHAPSFAFAKPRRGRLVVVVHDLAWRDAPETFPRRGREWHEAGLRRALRHADHFVVPSQATATRLSDAGADLSRITVIEEGSDHLPAPDDEGAAAVVKGEFILTVGTREPRKNIARLLDAYGLARLALPQPWPLVVVGPAGWGAEERPQPGVLFAGSVTAPVLAALYRRARVFVYVPLVEGFGLPPVEAMRAGAPVVASTRVPSTKGAALEVDAADVDAIAAAVVAAAEDGPQRDDLIARGSKRAGHLTWRNAAVAHLDLWKSLAQ